MGNYEITIFWSAEDQCFIVEVPDLPGCLAHGSTYESAARSATEAIDLRIESARLSGLTLPEPRQHQTDLV